MNETDPYAGERLKLSPFYPQAGSTEYPRMPGLRGTATSSPSTTTTRSTSTFASEIPCGTYDICPMQKYEIQGRDAEAMLNRMVTRDVTKIGLNRVAYCVWCTDDGRMIDDGTIFRLAR